MSEISQLLGIMAQLREPDGCPWDRAQTRKSLRSYLLEEAFEVADAIDGGAWEPLAEELGDLLLQVVFLARLGEEAGAFCFEDVVRGICEKLIRRHPHVFAEGKADTPEEVVERWDEIKRQEKQNAGQTERRSALDGIPNHLPALVKAHRLTERVARAGFDWPGPSTILAKIEEELRELREAIAQSNAIAIDDEMGDLLFAVASLARHLEVDPEGALARASRKFSHRFRHVETLAQAAERSLSDLDTSQLDTLWRRAKDEDPSSEIK